MPHLDDLQEDKIGDLTPSVMNYAEAKSRLPDPSYTVLRSGSSIRAVYLYHQYKNDIDDPKAKSGLVYRVNGLNVIFTRSGSLQFGDHAAGLGGLIAGEEPPRRCGDGRKAISQGGRELAGQISPSRRTRTTTPNCGRWRRSLTPSTPAPPSFSMTLDFD